MPPLLAITRPIQPPDTPDPPGVEWPAQGTWAGVTEAVRNRNPSDATAEASGRGFGLDSRHGAAASTSAQIFHVTNLNPTGAGSLHQALVNESGNRIIVFDVGGEITANTNWNVRNPGAWVAGQTAPTQIWVNTGGNNLNIRSGNHMFQHMCFWHDVAATTADTLAVLGSVGGATVENIIIDHCFIGGGTDETLSMTGKVSDITVIDSLIAKPQFRTTNSHAFGSLIGDGQTLSLNINRLSLIGNIYSHIQQRGPLSRARKITICNHLVYNRNQAGVDFKAVGTSDAQIYDVNVVGLWEKRGDNHSGNSPIALGSGGGGAFSSDSLFYFSDTRAVEYSNDEWDVVNDPGNEESGVRSNTTAANGWPTGLVPAANRARSENDYLTLMTTNCGPRPSNRAVFVSTCIQEVVNGTGSIENTYSPPSIATSTSTFVVVSSAFDAGTDANRTKIEEQLLDLSESFLQ